MFLPPNIYVISILWNSHFPLDKWSTFSHISHSLRIDPLFWFYLWTQEPCMWSIVLILHKSYAWDPLSWFYLWTQELCLGPIVLISFRTQEPCFSCPFLLATEIHLKVVIWDKTSSRPGWNTESFPGDFCWNPLSVQLLSQQGRPRVLVSIPSLCSKHLLRVWLILGKQSLPIERNKNLPGSNQANSCTSSDENACIAHKTGLTGAVIALL